MPLAGTSAPSLYISHVDTQITRLLPYLRHLLRVVAMQSLTLCALNFQAVKLASERSDICKA